MNHQAGFTLIELVVVFTIMAILGTIGVVSLSSYNSSQLVTTTMLDLKSMFQQAQSDALSQVQPSACPTDLNNPNVNSNLLGYEVDFCAGALIGEPAACKTNTDYEVNALCDNGVGYVNEVSKKYSSSLTISSTHRSYFFPVITGGVNNAGTITVSAYGHTQKIIVSTTGVIK